MFDKIGKGPVVILVDGALCYRAFGPSAQLAKLLSENFTVITYDRRGRGESGDNDVYTVEKEIEDLDAIIKEVGGSVCLFGQSSGAALALEAAVRLKSVKKLAMYESPFFIDDSRSPMPENYFPNLKKAIAENRNGDAVKMFMKLVGTPSIFVLIMPLMPMWGTLKGVADTLVYDTILMKDNQQGKPLSKNTWSSIKIPVLAINGGKSPTWMKHAMQSLSEVLGAEYKSLDGQTHMVKSEALVSVLENFFKE